jgi:hypothetical protein
MSNVVRFYGMQKNSWSPTGTYRLNYNFLRPFSYSLQRCFCWQDRHKYWWLQERCGRRVSSQYSVWLQMNDRDSIHGRGKGFSISRLWPDQLSGPPSLLSNGYPGGGGGPFPGAKRGRGVTQTTYARLVLRSSSCRLHGGSGTALIYEAMFVVACTAYYLHLCYTDEGHISNRYEYLPALLFTSAQ